MFQSTSFDKRPATGLHRNNNDENIVPSKQVDIKPPFLNNPVQKAAADEEEEVQAKAMQKATAPEEEELQAKTDPLQKAGAEEEEMQMKEEEEVQAKAVQKAVAPEEEELQAKTNPLQKAGAEEEEMQMKEEEEPLQGKFKKESAPKEVIRNGSNTSMPTDVQAKMENSFGADFSNVNIHKNDDSATQVGALAYTQGNDVHFAPGQYNPSSQKGQELLGHELTHVVQQRQGRVAPTKQGKGMSVNDNPSLEKEADDMGAKAANGEKVNVSSQTSNNQVQMKRELPSGVQRIEIESNKVIQEFSKLWRQRPAAYQDPMHFDTPENFTDHPDLPSLVRGACGGRLFYGQNTWNSGWLDDGDTDFLWAGDADVKAEIIVYIDNERERGSSQVTNNASGEFNTSDQRSRSTEYSGTVNAGVEKGPASAGVEGGIKYTEGRTNTDSSKGSLSTSMDLATKLFQADIKMDLLLWFRPSIAGPPGLKKCNLSTPVVGRVLFDSPF